MYRSIAFLISVLVVSCAADDYNETMDTPKPVRDRFRIILANVDEEKLSDEITDFTTYGCEKMAVIRNRAHEEFKISCQSRHESPKKKAVVKPGNAFAFSFRPQKNGNSVFWCTVEYKEAFARFDVYNEEGTYMCPRDIDEVYQYVVYHDGIYVDKSKGNNGQKIRALFKGHNKFILWEEYENATTDGFLLGGVVDGGMCYDIPDQFNDKAAAVTICYNHCVHLYEHYGCQGRVQTIQAMDDCIDKGLEEELGGKLSAIQGC